jgi:hypothetical protein
MKTLDERTHAFVVRLWEERREDPGAERQWRGSIEEVRSGARFYFVNLVQLCDLLRERCSRSERADT